MRGSWLQGMPGREVRNVVWLTTLMVVGLTSDLYLVPAFEKDVVFLIQRYEVSYCAQIVRLFLDGVCQGYWREYGQRSRRQPHDCASSSNLDSTKAQERRAAGDEIGSDLANEHHLLRIGGDEFCDARRHC